MLNSMYITTQGATPVSKGLWTVSLLLADDPAKLYAQGISVIRTFEGIERTRGLMNAQDLFSATRWVTLKNLVGDPHSKEDLHRTRVPFDRYPYLPLGSSLRSSHSSGLPRLSIRESQSYLPRAGQAQMVMLL
jgi:hypothetical protein